MVLWPAVALIGFVALTALVILMGTSSTARYEQEQRAIARRSSGPAPAGAEAVQAVQAARAA